MAFCQALNQKKAETVVLLIPKTAYCRKKDKKNQNKLAFFSERDTLRARFKQKMFAAAHWYARVAELADAYG